LLCEKLLSAVNGLFLFQVPEFPNDYGTGWKLVLEAVLKIFHTAFFGKKSVWQKRYYPFEHGKIRLWYLAKSQNFFATGYF